MGEGITLRPHTKANIFLVVLFVLCVAAIVFLCRISKVEATTTIIYATVNRTTFLERNTPTVNDCENWSTGSAAVNCAFIHIGQEHQWDGDVGEGYWFVYWGTYSFPLSTLTGTLDSARVVIPIQTKSVACTGDPYINVYTGDCAIAGGCTGAATINDTSSCTDLRRAYKVSEFPVGGNFTMRVDSCITIGGTHTLDMRFGLSVTPINGVCLCVLDRDNEITFTGATAADPYKPYLVVYTHTDSPSTSPTSCVFPHARLQTQVNNSTPKRLKIGSPGRGLAKWKTS